MAGSKEIKRRIRSAKNIGQITKALQMVSAVKMRKAQLALEEATPYSTLLNQMFQDFLTTIDMRDIETLAHASKNNHDHIGLIIISPSKGFAGSLLSNLAKRTLECIDRMSSHSVYEENEGYVSFSTPHDDASSPVEQVDIQLITVEKKSKEFALKLSKHILADFPKLSVPPRYGDITPIARVAIDGYTKGELDEVYVVYTHFISSFAHAAVIRKLFPLSQKKQEQEQTHVWTTFSDQPEALFNDFYPLYIEQILFHAVLDAVAAEHSARMIAMKNATDNANDLRRELTLEYNQKRQAAITQEIAEITSASDTL